MRHGKKFNHLGRKSAHRKAMLANMACSLIEHKRISTTVAKAKALRPYVEPMITRSKVNTTHNRRTVFSYLQNKEAVKELFDEVGAKVAARPGGYTRILRTGFRLGDAAEMCIIELVDYNENLSGGAGSGSGKKKRTRRSKSKQTDAAAKDATATDSAAAAVDPAADIADAVENKVEEVQDRIVDNVEEAAPETPSVEDSETPTEDA